MQTPHVIILWKPVTKASFEAIPVPKRMLTSTTHGATFLGYFENAVPVGNDVHIKGGWFDLYYILDKESWLHVYTQMLQVTASKRMAVLRWFATIVMGIFGGFAVLDSVADGSGWLFPSMTLAVIMIIMNIIMKNPGLNMNTYRRMLEKNRLPIDGQGKWELACMDDRIRVNRPDKTYDCKWEDYCQLIETEDTYFLVHMNEIKLAEVLPIPKWVFDSEDEMGAFLSFCQTKGVKIEKSNIKIYTGREMKKLGLICGGIILALLIAMAVFSI